MVEGALGVALPRIEIRGAERRDVRSGWRFQIHVFTEEGRQYLTWAGHAYKRAMGLQQAPADGADLLRRQLSA